MTEAMGVFNSRGKLSFRLIAMEEGVTLIYLHPEGKITSKLGSYRSQHSNA